jgi:hypothetical protein
MNFSPFADAFVPLFKKHKLPESITTTNTYALSLYKDIFAADKSVEHCPAQIKSVHTPHSKAHSALPQNNNYFPKAIRTYIQTTPSSLFKYTCKVKEREININFYCFPATMVTPDLTKYVKIMFTWLAICAKYAQKKCATAMSINIYLTPFKKTLPTNKTTVLSAEHVNTAFTMSCAPDGEITIYREEEWFKVFIHETFHAYSLDFGLHETTALRRVLARTFPITSDFEANEAYAETWARIINCALYSFYSLDNKQDSATFFLYFDFSLQLERLFATYQMHKVLNFMGLKYNDLYERRENSAYLRQQLYKEHTHVFSYYILTAIFLNDYRQFIDWCGTNNANAVGANAVGANAVADANADANADTPMKFNCHAQSFLKMGVYIDAIYKNALFLSTIAAVQAMSKKHGELQDTTRMAIIDMLDL